MRYSLVCCAAIMVALLVSCNKEEAESPLPQSYDSIFTANIQSPSTKTTLSDGTKVLWSTGDKILINNGSVTKTFTTEGSGASAEFKCSFDKKADSDEFTNVSSYTAFYGETWNTIPSSVSYTAGKFDNIPMTATAGSDRKFTFTNCCAVIKVSLATAVSSLKIDSEDNIAGTIGSLSSNSITATSSSACDLFYIAVAPGSHKLTISAGERTMTMAAAAQMEAGKIYEINFGKADRTVSAGSVTLPAQKIDYTLNLADSFTSGSDLSVSVTSGDVWPDNIYIDAKTKTIGTLTIDAVNSHVEVINGTATTVNSTTSNTSLVLKSFDATTINLNAGSLVLGDGTDANDSNVGSVVVPSGKTAGNITVTNSSEITGITLEGTAGNITVNESGSISTITVGANGDAGAITNNSSTELDITDPNGKLDDNNVTGAKKTQVLTFADSGTYSITYGSVSSFEAAAKLTTHLGDGTLTWSITEGSDYASINQSTGLVSITKAGTVTIKVSATETDTYSANDATCTLTINKASQTFSVDGVSNAKMQLTLNLTENPEGRNESLSISGTTYGNLTWNSSATDVASVSDKGVLTLKKSGKTTISVTAAGNDNYSENTVEFELTVYVPVTGISLSPSSIAVTYDDLSDKTISVTIVPEGATNKNVKWSKTGSDKIRIDGGTVTFDPKGNKWDTSRAATITCTSDDNRDIIATCSVTVTEAVTAVTGVSLNETSKTVGVGDSFNLNPTITPSDATDKTVSWNSSNSQVATVDAGQVTAIGIGECDITCTSNSDNTKSASCHVTVQATKVTSISLNPSSITLEKAASYNAQKIVATVNPSNATDKSLTWSSNNSSFIDVDNNGNLSFKQSNTAGEATITCSANDGSGVSATCKVTITGETVVPVTGLTLKVGSSSVTSNDVIIGSNFTLTPVITPTNATTKTVTWSTSDDKIASVDNTGKVTGVGLGTATITCKADGGTNVVATCTVYVTIQSITFSPSSPSMSGSTNSVDVTANVNPACSSTFSWTLSGSDFSLSSATGKTITVTVTKANKTKSCTLKCKVNEDPKKKEFTCTVYYTK